ncbi:MAG TPA: glycosyltransferase family 2 protein, partial [Acidobacteriota bacterium]|nr:glycosyltransferase family 2 protein [Acidobacteriota bacterium]
HVLLFWHSLGNKMLTLLANMLNDLNLSDMETGYKVFNRSVLESIQIRSDRFGFEPEFTAKVARGKFRIYEVPVSYYGRGYKEGKKITWRDGMAALFWIFRYRFFH